MTFKDPDVGKPAKQLKKERYQRMHTARTLGVPDRVPVSTPIGSFPAKYCNILCSDAYYDHDKWYAAYEKTLKDFCPDTFGATPPQSGKALEILDPKTQRWPGHGVDPHQAFQAIEIDGLKANEFDEYMKDSNSYMLRKQVPRTSDKLAGLGSIPPLYQVLHGPGGAQSLAMVFSDRNVAKAVRVLQQVGREMRKIAPMQKKFMKLLQSYGYYSSPMVGCMPPYDSISHSIRGMTGTMQDMFRQPDKLVELCEFVLKEELEQTPFIPDEHGEIGIFMTNTRGSDDFLSKKQYERFYWPTFKKLVTELCNRGCTPYIFFEGNCDSRMEGLLELPKGKFVARLDTSDIFRAKDILKGHCCIEGNIPSSLLQMGSVDDVKAYCKKLIDHVGKDGGYILSPRSSTDEVKPQNLQAMIQFTKEYGVYR
jgi:uroporphyrinogen-III decarboxylase